MKIAQIYPFTLGSTNAEVSSAMISKDGELFGALVGGHPVLLDFSGGKIELPAEVRTSHYRAAALSPDGQHLALGTDERLSIIVLSSDVVHAAFTDPVYHIVWGVGGEQLVVGHQRNKLSFWNSEAECANSLSLRVPRSQRNWLVSFSADGEHIFAASAFPDPNWLCASSNSQARSRLRLPPGKFIHGLIPWRDGVLGILSDHTARFELIAYKPNLKPQPVKPVLLKADVTALSACPEEHWLAAGTVDGELWILDAETLNIKDQILLWHTPIRTVSASADYVVAGASDGKLKVVELFE